MVYNYGLLQWKIKEVCGTQTEFAIRSGRSRQYISSVLNNKQGLSQNEIHRWCELLGIDIKDIPDYFFCTSS